MPLGGLVVVREAVLGADRVEGVDRREEEERGLCINQSVSRVPFGENAAVLAETSGSRPRRHAIELTSRRWCGGHDSAAAGNASRQFDLCTERRREDRRLELGLARQGLLAAADEHDKIREAVEEAHSWGEENGENTLHEPATATTKPKRTTQTKETSWHTPAVIYRLAVNAEDSEH